MPIRFFHAADIHLGYRQYGSEERRADFTLAFRRMVDDAVTQKVDFVILAGDLFHKRDMDPLTLYEATQELIRLRSASIPTYAIEGNHEQPHATGATSWLDFLSRSRLLTLLTPEIRQGQLHCEPYDDARARGAYVDLTGDCAGIRIVGQEYKGASTPAQVWLLAESLASLPGPKPRYTVLMLHAGLEGVLAGYSGSLSRNDLEALRPHVDYLALGHIHKPYSQDDWIYNPGSLEANSVQEVVWDDRGYLDVSVDLGASPPHRVTKRRSGGRPFLLLGVAVDRYASPTALHQGVVRYLEDQRAERPQAVEPVVELRLTGTLPFDRVDLDTAALRGEAERILGALICNVHDLTTSRDLEIRLGETLGREELERQVLFDLASRDASKQPDADRWAELCLALKLLGDRQDAPELVIAELESFLEAV